MASATLALVPDASGVSMNELTARALQVLGQILDDPEASPSLRLRAAAKILDYQIRVAKMAQPKPAPAARTQPTPRPTPEPRSLEEFRARMKARRAAFEAQHPGLSTPAANPTPPPSPHP